MKKQILARTETALFSLEIREPEFPHKQFSGCYDGQPPLAFPQKGITRASDFPRVSFLTSGTLEARTEEELLTQFYRIVRGSYGEILEVSTGSPY